MWCGTSTFLHSTGSPAARQLTRMRPQSITWLILARAVAGVGGGGIVSSVWTITSEIVDVRNQAKWSQALSITWACSAVAGPLLGGLFSSESECTGLGCFILSCMGAYRRPASR